MIRIGTERRAWLSLAVLLGALGSAPSARAAVSVNVGSATGSPGSTVMFFVTLTTTAGEQVAATDTTIDFESETPLVQCTTNPAFVISQCEKFPTGCTPGVDCQETRCIIAPFGGTISSGSQLYFCNVHIAANAASGEYALHCSAVDVRDGAGNSLNPQCTDGHVQVVPPTPTPTATPTPTPTATRTPTITPTPTATPPETTGEVGPTDTCIPVSDTSVFSPTGGFALIGGELISYTGIAASCPGGLATGAAAGAGALIGVTRNLNHLPESELTHPAETSAIPTAAPSSTPVPGGGGGGGGCQIASVCQSYMGLLLMVPAVLLWQRRRRSRW